MSDDIFRLFNAGVTASLTAQQYRAVGDHAGASVSEYEALGAFERILAFQPDHPGALEGKGMSLAQLGRAREAADCFQRGTALEPRSAENHRQLGLCYAELGDLEAARAASRRAVELDGSAEYREQAAIELYQFGLHIMALGAGHRDEGRPSEAECCYRHAQGLFILAVEIDPDNEDARDAVEVAEQCLDGAIAKPWWRFW